MKKFQTIKNAMKIKQDYVAENNYNTNNNNTDTNGNNVHNNNNNNNDVNNSSLINEIINPTNNPTISINTTSINRFAPILDKVVNQPYLARNSGALSITALVVVPKKFANC